LNIQPSAPFLKTYQLSAAWAAEARESIRAVESAADVKLMTDVPNEQRCSAAE
jgi:hypothetical protein